LTDESSRIEFPTTPKVKLSPVNPLRLFKDTVNLLCALALDETELPMVRSRKAAIELDRPQWIENRGLLFPKMMPLLFGLAWSVILVASRFVS